jgi:hypothetical protein
MPLVMSAPAAQGVPQLLLPAAHARIEQSAPAAAAAAGSFIGALAYRTTNQTNQSAVVSYTSEAYDTDAFHDDAVNPSRFTIPLAYNGRKARLSGGHKINAAAGQVILGQNKNGAVFHGRAAVDSETAGDSTVNGMSAPVDVATGDYFENTADAATGDLQAADTWGQIEILPASFNGALVRSSVTQAISSGASPVTLSWDTEEYDTGGFHDGGNPSRLTVPSGVSKVRLTANVVQPSSAGILTTEIRKNGAVVHGLPGYVSDTAGQDFANLKSAVVDVVAGDYFEFIVSTTDAATLNILANESTWFAIEAIPATRKGALVKRSSNFAVSAGVSTAVAWNDEEYDTDGFHDTGSNPSRLTIPSGVSKVRLTAAAITSASTTQLIISMLKNGAAFTGGGTSEAAGGTERVNAVSAVVDVVAGDYFELSLFSTAAINVSSNVLNWFSIEVME